MGMLIMAGQLMLSLSILIVLHEMGHFIPARLFGTRVEKFYLFFDPWFELFKWKVGETEYGIGWLPLGGYVKISGMIDESFDTEQMAQEPQPWEFRSKPAWQRLIIMLGGVTVNFILGFFLYAIVLWGWGEKYLPAEEAKYGIFTDSLGQELGLRDGDKILSIGDAPFDVFERRILFREIVINSADNIKVERNGQVTQLPVDPKFIGELASHKNKGSFIFDLRFPFIAAQLAEGAPAEKSGMKVGDQIVSLNGIPTPYFNEFTKLAVGLKDQDITVGVLRDGQPIDLAIRTTEEGQIGVFRMPLDSIFKFERKEYSFLAALPAGTVKGWNFLTSQIKAFGQMFKGNIKPSDSLGGFGSIGKMFGDIWIWERFWEMTAILSLILAFMNLLPIPALDGGHVMFLLYEVVSGRKPSDKFMEYATMIGFVVVIGLVLYANGLDVFRWLFPK